MSADENPHIYVCNRCGYIWEPRGDSRRPQCSSCRSTSKRRANKEEISRFRAGEKFINADSTSESTLEPGYPIDENHHADVDSVDIDALINAPDKPPIPPTPAAETQGDQPEKSGVSMYCIITVCGALMAIAAGAYFLARRRSRVGNTQAEYYEEPEEMMQYGDIYTVPGAPGAFS